MTRLRPQVPSSGHAAPHHWRLPSAGADAVPSCNYTGANAHCNRICGGVWPCGVLLQAHSDRHCTDARVSGYRQLGEELSVVSQKCLYLSCFSQLVSISEISHIRVTEAVILSSKGGRVRLGSYINR